MDNFCNSHRKWYLFVLVDMGIYFGGLLLILFWLLLKKLFCRRRLPNADTIKLNDDSVRYQTQLDSEGVADEYVCFVALRLYIGELLSNQFLTGKLILLVSTMAAVVSICLYLYEVIGVVGILERCDPMKNWVFCVDLGCNLLFLFHFLLRFTGSSGKVAFWFSIFTIVDLFTIPQSLTSLYLSREWFGLRFLRIVSLTKVSMVMQNLNMVKSSTSIRIISLTTLFLCIWIGGAGFLHLLENSGELTFGSLYSKQNPLSFWSCLYFIVVTLSTVGYGDITAVTVAGKVFVTFFILIALAVFASFIPELAEFIFSQSSYSGNYQKESGRRHVIVCGHINFNSVSTFLADFFHEDRSIKNVEVVFLNKNEPQEDLKGLLKSYLQVKYFQGSAVNHNDLDRVQMGSADACLILANQNCLHPNDEDAGNTMRAISFKNFCHACPVIIQLLQFENKIYLENIPTWNRRNGDQIICYSEIELGILAQSCLVPGFSTLLTNLFSVRSAEGCQHLSKNSSWLKNYMTGTTLEIYSAKFSPSFMNMNYKDLVEVCLKKLNLLLIAIEVIDRHQKKTLLINPLNCKNIYSNTIGYFVCDSYKDAQNASLYCKSCHSGFKNLKYLRKCLCKEIKEGAMAKIICLENDYESNIDESFIKLTADKRKKNNQFYQMQWQTLSDCIIYNESQTGELNDHIILCIFSEKESPLIGLKNFLTPLRSTTIPESELKDLLIIADKDFIEKEWLEISRFPKIKVVFHSFSIRRMTNLLAIERCSRCVILNAKSNFRDQQNDLYMVDKEIIITNLYFQATFRKNLKRRQTRTQMEDRFQPTIIPIENTRTLPVDLELTGPKWSEYIVPIISKLAIESNVQFLDVKETDSKKVPNYLRKPFAFGYVFTANMLDSLLSTAYFSPNAISIMEILINGGLNCQIENENEDEKISTDTSVNRIRIDLVPVGEFSRCENAKTTIYYSELFVEALQQHNSLCLGLYRKLNLTHGLENGAKIDRYVITNPPSTFPLDNSDLVYCLKQINYDVIDTNSLPL